MIQSLLRSVDHLVNSFRPDVGGRGRTDASLYFIDDHENTMFLRQRSQRVKECRRGMIITTLYPHKHISLPSQIREKERTYQIE